MEQQNIKNLLPNIIPAGAVFVLLGGLLIYGFTEVSTLTKRVDLLTSDLASTTMALSETTVELSGNLTDLRAQTVGLSDTLSSTQQNINDVKTQVGGVEQTVGSISGTVGDLQKLSQIDPELLKKYSKVFFMNENYVPAHLVTIPTDNLYSVSDSQQFLTEAWPFLQSMLAAAESDGVTLYVKSAYRSFGKQAALKSSYTVIYGVGTSNTFSADQGYSEHQIGTTIDLITTGLGGQLDGFGDTEPYQWLLKNAYRFGFVLSYPEGNAHYVYEPWHWRFVGVDLATYLHDKNLNFYDLDQREIDTYLISIFD